MANIVLPMGHHIQLVYTLVGIIDYDEQKYWLMENLPLVAIGNNGN